MTKNFKLVLALALAAMMIVSMIPAMAASITVNTTGTNITTNHTYKAYALFTGDPSEDGTKLSNVQWGTGINHESLFTKIEANGSSELKAKFASLTAEDKAKAVKVSEAMGTITEANLVKELSVLMAGCLGTAANDSASNPITGLTPGYYLITDETDVAPNTAGNNDAKSAYLLQILGDEDITIKTDAPSVTKKILENGNNKKDTNTATIGDDISYEIESAIPDHTYYDYYYFIINDDLSTGLTFNNDIKVYKSEPYTDEENAGKFKPEEELTVDQDYYVYTDSATCGAYDFKVALENAKALPVGTKIFVRYSAKLNDKAVIGESGNPNDSDLTYSNNPNDSGRGDKTGKKGIPDETHSTQTGTTPKDRTITYTAQIDILKTKNNSTDPLKGAEFTLTGTSTKTVLKGKKVYTEATDGTFYRLTDGTWTTTPPTGPYMEAKAGATAGYVEDSSYTKDDKIVIGEKTYRPYVAETDASKTVYVYNKGNGDSYASTTTKYKEETATEITKQTYPVKMVVTSGDNGHVIFSELGEGTYTIEETKVPDGYNKAENVTLEIKVDLPTGVTTGIEKATWSVGSDSTPGKFTARTEGTPAVATVGIYDTNIINKSGATLPETGGVGTTIFYVAGSIMVLAAAILLITKRRMGAND